MTIPLDLPEGVLELGEFQPVEDLLLRILRDGIPSMTFCSLIPDEPTAPFALVRRVSLIAEWTGDDRFVDVARFAVECFAADPDGDEKAARIAEAVRVVLRNAWLNHASYPDLGSVAKITMNTPPTRETDWATSSGPVQYADLPAGWWRYEGQWTLTVRKPR